MSDTEDNWLKETGVIILLLFTFSHISNLKKAYLRLSKPCIFSVLKKAECCIITTSAHTQTHAPFMEKRCTEMDCSKKLHNVESASVLTYVQPDHCTK